MPGTPVTFHELDQIAAAPDQEMRRDAQIRD